MTKNLITGVADDANSEHEELQPAGEGEAGASSRYRLPARPTSASLARPQDMVAVKAGSRCQAWLSCVGERTTGARHWEPEQFVKGHHHAHGRRYLAIQYWDPSGEHRNAARCPCAAHIAHREK